MAVGAKGKIWLLAATVLTGPAFFLIMIPFHEALSPVGYKLFPELSAFGILVSIAGISIYSTIVVFMLLWIVENNSARLHEIEGIRRLSLLSMLGFLVWAVYSYIDGGRFNAAHALELFLVIPFFPATAWLAVNVAGWLIEGFRSKKSADR